MTAACLLAGLAVLLAMAPLVNAQTPASPPTAGLVATGALVEPFVVDAGALRVVLPRGSLTLRPSADDRVYVRGELAPGQRLRVAMAPREATVRLLEEGRLMPAPATLVIEVPATLALAVVVDDAALDLQGVGGDWLRIEGGARPLRVASPARRASVRSGAGRLDLSLGGEILDVSTFTGAIVLDARRPGVRLRAESIAGDIRLSVVSPGSMRLEALSGRLDVTTGQGDAAASLETVSGDIDLRLAEQASAVFRFDAGRAPLRLRGGWVAGADGRSRIGSENWPVRVATVSGRMTVRQGVATLAESTHSRD